MRPDIKANLKSQIESTKAHCESEIERLTEEAKQFDKRESFHTAACDLKDLYESYLVVGFTEEQAWELIKILVAK